MTWAKRPVFIFVLAIWLGLFREPAPAAADTAQSFERITTQREPLFAELATALKKRNARQVDSLVTQIFSDDFYPALISRLNRSDIKTVLAYLWASHEVLCATVRTMSCTKVTLIALNMMSSEHIGLSEVENATHNLFRRVLELNTPNIWRSISKFDFSYKSPTAKQKKLRIKTILVGFGYAGETLSENLAALDEAIQEAQDKGVDSDHWVFIKAENLRIELLARQGELEKAVVLVGKLLEKVKNALDINHPTRIQVELHAFAYGEHSNTTTEKLLARTRESWIRGELPIDDLGLAYSAHLNMLVENKVGDTEFNEVFENAIKDYDSLEPSKRETFYLIQLAKVDFLIGRLRYREALEVIERFEAGIGVKLEITNPLIDGFTNRKIDSLIALSDLSKAIELIDKRRKELATALGLSNPRTANLVFRQANLLSMVRGQGEATFLLGKELHDEVEKEGANADLVMTIRAKKFLAKSYENHKKDIDTAIKLLEQGVKLLGQSHLNELQIRRESVVMLLEIYRLRKKVGDEVKADEAYRLADNLRKQLPALDPDILLSMDEAFKITERKTKSLPTSSSEQLSELREEYIRAVRQEGKSSELAIVRGLKYARALREADKTSLQFKEGTQLLNDLYLIADSNEISLTSKIAVYDDYQWLILFEVGKDKSYDKKASLFVEKLLELSQIIRNKDDLSLRFRSSILSIQQQNIRFMAHILSQAIGPSIGLELFENSKATLIGQQAKLNQKIRNLIDRDDQLRSKALQITNDLSKLYEANTPKSGSALQLQEVQSKIDSLELTLQKLADNRSESVFKESASTSPNKKAADLLSHLPPETSYISLLHLSQDSLKDYVTAIVVTPDKRLSFFSLGRLSPQGIELLRLSLIHGTSLNRVLSEDGKVAVFQNNGDGPSAIRRKQDLLPSDKPISGPDELIKRVAPMFSPVFNLLGESKSVVISADGYLSQLPFGSLPLDDGKPLASKLAISYAFSLEDFVLRKKLSAEYKTKGFKRPLLAFGNPLYELTDGTSRLTLRSARRKIQLNSVQELLDMRNLWENLPGTEREVKSIQKIFENEGLAVLGDSATERYFRSLLLTGQIADSENLLFSLHGYQSESNPYLSSLVFGSNETNTSLHDGYLTAAEIQYMALPHELVYVSACETGVGDPSDTLGTVGLPYALTVAGAANILMTLWPIDDEATVLFTTKFFERIKAGKSKSKALMETKVEFMKHPNFSSPFYWAPFVLYGS